MSQCAKCGSSDRNSRGNCIPCVRASLRAWRAANPERSAAIDARYKSANREKVLAGYAAYRATNRDRRAAYRVANIEKQRLYQHNRRARERAAGGKLSPDLSEKLFKLQRGKCACCGQSLGKEYHLDHVMPIALGGTNTDDNMQLLTATCNRQKHAKHPVEFMQQRGFLL